MEILIGNIYLVTLGDIETLKNLSFIAGLVSTNISQVEAFYKICQCLCSWNMQVEGT